MAKPTCVIDDCELPVRCRELCSRHYQRFTRKGTTDLQPKVDTTCIVDGCETLWASRRMCQKHYLRLKHHGTTDHPNVAKQARQCTAEGCERPVKSREMCTMHYQRLMHHGTTKTQPRPSLEERLLAKLDKTDTCWVWNAATHRGYGQIGIGRKVFYAHRVSYELYVGPIPEGMQLDHICHTPLCVKPDHLRPVTQKQNQENLKGARRHSKSGVRGVRRAKYGRWIAEVGHNGRTIYVGMFDTIEEADAAAKAKRLELFTHNVLDRGESVA